MRISERVDLAQRCYFRIGGPADYFAAVAGPEELARVLAFARRRGLSTFLLGAGSNLFFDDRGFRGLVVRMADRRLEIAPDRRSVLAGAGWGLPALVRRLARCHLGGLTFLGNIPGTLGGAVVGNAGCYGRSLGEVVEKVVICDRQRGRVVEVEPAWCGFAYRRSRLQEEGGPIVVAVRLRLEGTDGAAVLVELEEELARRRSMHPQDQACAGSFFKNPPGQSAWQLIDRAGLREAREGAAALSPKHPNFIVNRGGATSEQVRTLAARVQRQVEAATGIRLEPEVRYVSPTGVGP